MKTQLIRMFSVFAFVCVLSGCATPLGRQWGTAGAFGGGIIGGALGGWEGAAAGTAAGAIIGGSLGDHEQLEMERGNRHGPPYRHGYRQGYPYGHRYPNGGGGYVRPCYRVNVPVYDSWGNAVGYRTICQ